MDKSNAMIGHKMELDRFLGRFEYNNGRKKNGTMKVTYTVEWHTSNLDESQCRGCWYQQSY